MSLSLQTTLTKTVILETDTHCYKTFPLAKPCKGKGSGKGLKDKFSKGKGRALWIDAGPIVGRDGSVTVGSEAAMNALIKPTRAKAKGDDEENLPQVGDNERTRTRSDAVKVYDIRHLRLCVLGEPSALISHPLGWFD